MASGPIRRLHVNGGPGTISEIFTEFLRFTNHERFTLDSFSKAGPGMVAHGNNLFRVPPRSFVDCKSEFEPGQQKSQRLQTDTDAGTQDRTNKRLAG